MSSSVWTWNPLLPAAGCALVVVAIGVWGWAVTRRIRVRFSPARTGLLLLPKALALTLLTVAFLNPIRTTPASTPGKNRILLLVDTSSSMAVRDDGESARLDRALRAVDTLRGALPDAVTLTTLAFDTELRGWDRPPGADGRPTPPLRGTDLAGCLLQLQAQADLSAHAAIVLVTDGGDEPVDLARPFTIPLDILGVGADPSRWNDLEIAAVDPPASAEKEVDFEIAATIHARAAETGFARSLASVAVALERDDNGAWHPLEIRRVDLSNRRARVRFRTACDTDGLFRYRVKVEAQPGEISDLNNVRTVSVEVRKKALHVLFFTRQLGMDMKMIRSELAGDPGIAFTALYRTLGERFIVQGERRSGDESLTAGFPQRADTLRLFDCVVVGSFEREDWSDKQMAALVEYVRDGGSVVFLGGNDSFGAGRYARTPLADLFPWSLADRALDMTIGVFPVHLPAAARNHPILAGIPEALADAGPVALESLNPLGPLKPGATGLMTAQLADGAVPVIAVQRYGKGSVLGIGSNTLWKWARRSAALRKAFGLFWRQAVRHLGGLSETGQWVSVAWDKTAYRPGERATARIRVAGDRDRRDLRLQARLTRDGQSRPVGVEPVQGHADAFTLTTEFQERGRYHLALSAFRGDDELESYEKQFEVAPLLDEGAQLALDEPFLAALAAPSDGRYFPVERVRELAAHLVETRLTRSGVVSKSVVYDTVWVAAGFLACVTAELLIRRRLNLV